MVKILLAARSVINGQQPSGGEIAAFQRPQTPDFALHSALHRHTYHVVLARQQNGQFQQLGSILAKQQAKFGGGMVDHLAIDGFASINGFWANPQRNSKYKVGAAVLPRASRMEKFLQYINATYADLDCYSKGLTTGRVVGELLDMQDEKKIPPISALLRSGRGVWVFWLMRGNRVGEGRLSQRATKIAIHWTKAIQRAINGQLSSLGADPMATDLCRVCRIPGTVNSKADSSNNVVDYWLRHNSNGELATYTLEELGEWFRTPQPNFQRKESTSRTLNGGLDPKQTGRVRWERDHARLVKLINHRKKIPEGQRAATVYLIATILRGLGHTGTTLTDEAEYFWQYIERRCETERIRQCGTADETKHQFTRFEFDEILRRESNHPPSHIRIGNLLQLTPEEAELTGWPVAGTQPKEPPKVIRLQRRQWLRDFTDGFGPPENWPSYRETAEALRSEALRREEPTLACGKDLIATEIKLLKAEQQVQSSERDGKA